MNEKKKSFCNTILELLIKSHVAFDYFCLQKLCLFGIQDKCIYMEFRKMVTMTLYMREQKTHRCKEHTSVGEGESGMI